MLTESMQPVVQAIGFDAALRLVSLFGGTRVMVTGEPTERDPIARALGTEVARRLSAGIGPGLLDVPRCATWLMNRRNEEICIRHDGGETQAELALRFGLTERTIRTVLRQRIHILYLDEETERPTP